MNSPQHSQKPRPKHSKLQSSAKLRAGWKGGFALVVTLLALSLLALMILALTSLAQSDIRTTSNNQYAAVARNNAMMGLKKAIGELQLSFGPDQRISATARIMSDPDSDTPTVRHPHYLGSWHSWRAGRGEHEENIDAYSEHQTIYNGGRGDPVSASMHPRYDSHKERHFINWLVSLYPDEAKSIETPQSLELTGSTHPDGDADSVTLVDAGTLGAGITEQDRVRARLINVLSEAEDDVPLGRFGWWVTDDSQKARILGSPDDGESDPSTDLSNVLFRQQAPATLGNETIEELEMADQSRFYGLESLQTLNLVDGVVGKPSELFHDITTESFSLLTDVREGGTKRDFSILLEQEIDPSDSSDPYMLYRFGNNGVPIQDLSAYYQLYDDDPNWDRGRRGGIEHDGSGSVAMQTPDYAPGGDSDRDKYLREYTSLYRSPVPIKVQYLMAFGAQEITQEERDQVEEEHPDNPLRETDTHKLKIGGLPVVTLWNPNNVPLIMNNPVHVQVSVPPFAIRLRKYRNEGEFSSYPGWTSDNFINISFASQHNANVVTNDFAGPFIVRWNIAANGPVVFEPGEVKLFTIPSTEATQLNGTTVDADDRRGFHGNVYDATNNWDPYGFFEFKNSVSDARSSEELETADFDNRDIGGHLTRNLVFGDGDYITFQAGASGVRKQGAYGIPEVGRFHPGAVIVSANEIYGGGLAFHMIDHDARTSDTIQHFRHYQFMSRYGGVVNTYPESHIDFYLELMTRGFPADSTGTRWPRTPYDDKSNSFSASNIIAASSNVGEGLAFLQFSLNASCEAYEGGLEAKGGGRQTTTRPFLHGSTIAAPMIDQADTNSLYNYGWEWQVDPINGINESSVDVAPNTGNGFFGGGYTAEAGTTHVMQQDIPLVPPISIASLSHAHLGGFSLALDPVCAGAMDNVQFTSWSGAVDVNYRAAPSDEHDFFEAVTATGQGGLAPHVMQAIGNSYAHPNIPADKASSTWDRYFDIDAGPRDGEPFVDHSYLANKALWDEYFFSSITPQPSSIPFFDNGDRTAREVAEDFFFNDIPLPNSRIHPYAAHLDEQKLEDLFAEKDTYSDGLADKIASHLMVEGAFNINSTSVDAWIAFLSSLRNQPIATIDENGQLNTEQIGDGEDSGVPFAPGNLPNGLPIASEEFSDGSTNTPPRQWNSGRVISDEEIEQLAKAIVKQVKLRGPFLSLSEFVNRRLDSSDTDLAKKGALQAALDDPSVSINASFRNSTREFSSDEVNSMSPAFRAALEGPIAYGSAAYVDQADILRHFGSQLTPRGDTFVIRSYGDALDANGNVTARAWCEAVVQRIPEYVDDSDDPHLKYADLPENSASRRFGRKLEVVSFRWLHPSEL